MPDGNPIVAAAQDKVSWAEGSGLVQDAVDLVNQVDSGQWAAGLTSLLSAGLTVRDVIVDPVAKLASMGLGWVIEFFDPLNVWLDWLTCDSEQLTVAAETWSGIAAELRTAADELTGYSTTDTAGWSGPAVDQYRVFCADRVDLFNAAAGAAAATANLINRNKILLTVVRSIVRDLITDGIGKVISIVLRYPPPATLAASGEIAGQVQRTGAAIADLVRKLQQALRNAWDLLKRSGNIFTEVGHQIRQMRISVAGAARMSRVHQNSHLVAKVHNQHVDQILGQARDVGEYAVRTAGADAVGGLAEQVGMEILKEPTKYGQGRVDESAPGHPAVDGTTGDGR
ncbi:PPE domain-containing protein [Actinophytocola sp. KF-1]